jgi:hypothetical protein
MARRAWIPGGVAVQGNSADNSRVVGGAKLIPTLGDYVDGGPDNAAISISAAHVSV